MAVESGDGRGKRSGQMAKVSGVGVGAPFALGSGFLIQEEPGIRKHSWPLPPTIFKSPLGLDGS